MLFTSKKPSDVNLDPERIGSNEFNKQNYTWQYNPINSGTNSNFANQNAKIAIAGSRQSNFKNKFVNKKRNVGFGSGKYEVQAQQMSVMSKGGQGVVELDVQQNIA